MPYTLNVHVREAEPYTGLWTYDDVREAVEEEVRTTVDQLGSDILNEGTEAERDLVVEHLADAAMLDLFRQMRAGEDCTEHYLPGSIKNHETGERVRGVRLSLYEEK